MKYLSGAAADQVPFGQYRCMPPLEQGRHGPDCQDRPRRGVVLFGSIKNLIAAVAWVDSRCLA
jgi:hypothetical protein